VESKLFNGSVDMSSVRIHIAIPNATAMLCDPEVNLRDLRIAFVEGTYSEGIDNQPSQKTKFGSTRIKSLMEKKIRWGKRSITDALPYNDTIPLSQIVAQEGNFIIKQMIVEFPYDEPIAYYGIPTDVQKIAVHDFQIWNFAPTLLKKLFGVIENQVPPSHPLYQLIKHQKEKWYSKSKDQETYKRLRATWLINKPPEALPMKIYELWYGRGALIIPETLKDFRGRDLGTHWKKY
jgi:hypothetical protein